MSRLGMSFGGESPVVLTVPGRKSGTPRSTPVTPMTVDGKRYVVAGFPGADWVRNVRAAGEVTLTRGRSRSGCGWWSCPPRRPSRCCGLSHRGAHRCRLHEALRARQGGQPRGVRGAGRPLRGLPLRSGLVRMRRSLLACAVGGRPGCVLHDATVVAARLAARRAAPLPRPARRNGRSANLDGGDRPVHVVGRDVCGGTASSTRRRDHHRERRQLRRADLRRQAQCR